MKRLLLYKNVFIGFLILISATVFIQSVQRPKQHQPQLVTSAVANPDVLESKYTQWKQQRGQDKLLTMTLVGSDVFSDAVSAGEIHINLEDGLLEAWIDADLVGKEAAAPTLWLSAELPQPRQYGSYLSHLRELGEFSHSNLDQSRWRLQVDLNSLLKKNSRIAQFEVWRHAPRASESPLLAASPSLFQRLLAAELQSQQPSLGESLLNALVPVAQAAEATGFPDVFNDLVTQGEDVFFNETFDGNGRTCGTCHPATNNFTIDVDFIAGLPPTDPLFVAEFVPALMFGNAANLDSLGNPRRFENPALMRAFGLIVENQDGMGDLANRFNMRSVTHNIGMSVSITTPPNDLTPPDDRTGWGGDGAAVGVVGGIAASGRLRDFMLGAIVQHFPKTMERSFVGASPDFRAPTLSEIDAVEAFLLALGRQNELELAAGAPGELLLKDAGAEAGKTLFRDGVAGGTAVCNGCHSNAGANVNGGSNPGNRNFNTGVEAFLQNRILDPNFTVVGEPRPVDGGFGLNPSGDFTMLIPQPGFVNENFGDMRFNTPSLVEAADSAPFFHNNSAETLEDAIAFYASPEFTAATGAVIPLNATEITEVADFLRVINALDNIENLVSPQADRALLALSQSPVPNDVINRILQIMIADTNDAIDVLEDGNLHNSGGLPFNAVKQLQKARQRMQQAMNSSASSTARTNHINQAKDNLDNAVALMRF